MLSPFHVQQIYQALRWMPGVRAGSTPWPHSAQSSGLLANCHVLATLPTQRHTQPSPPVHPYLHHAALTPGQWQQHPKLPLRTSRLRPHCNPASMHLLVIVLKQVIKSDPRKSEFPNMTTAVHLTFSLQSLSVSCCSMCTARHS